MAGYFRVAELGLRVASGAHIIKSSDFEAVAASTEILHAAETKAAQIIAQAEEVYAHEKQRGYQDGLQEAALHACERLLQENRALDIGLKKLEGDISQLVMQCVRKLVEGYDEMQRAEAVVRKALKQMRHEKRAELKVPPALHARFKQKIESIIRDFPEIELIDVIEDASLDPAQIVVETSIGRLDANIGERLHDLELILAAIHGNPSLDSISSSQDAGGSDG